MATVIVYILAIECTEYNKSYKKQNIVTTQFIKYYNPLSI